MELSQTYELSARLLTVVSEFKAKIAEHYTELKTSECSLRKLEQDYKTEEQKFNDLVKEFNSQMGLKQEVHDDVSSNNGDGGKKRKNYEGVIQLECQVKLLQHSLMN
jgi:antirestriction protein